MSWGFLCVDWNLFLSLIGIQFCLWLSALSPRFLSWHILHFAGHAVSLMLKLNSVFVVPISCMSMNMNSGSIKVHELNKWPEALCGLIRTCCLY